MARYDGPKKTKAELQAEADAAMAAFLKGGKAVKQMPSVEVITFACNFCGHTGTIGARAGQAIRCPKCRSPITTA